MDINKNDTAVLVTDPQNDFLSEQGVTWHRRRNDWEQYPARHS